MWRAVPGPLLDPGCGGAGLLDAHGQPAVAMAHVTHSFPSSCLEWAAGRGQAARATAFWVARARCIA